jgi:hypothetical protein
MKNTLLTAYFICFFIPVFGQDMNSTIETAFKGINIQSEGPVLKESRLLYVINNYSFAGVSNDMNKLKRYTLLSVKGKGDTKLGFCREILFSWSKYKDNISGSSISYKDCFVTFGIGGIVGLGSEDFNPYLRAVIGPAYSWGEFRMTNPTIYTAFGDFSLYYNAAVGVDLFSAISFEVGISKIPFISIGLLF